MGGEEGSPLPLRPRDPNEGGRASRAKSRPQSGQPTLIAQAERPRYHIARPQRPPSDATPPGPAPSARRSFDTGRVNVFVRVRPLGQRERDQDAFPCVEEDKKRHVLLSEFCEERDYLRQNRLRCRSFTFDAVFGPASRQAEVYALTTAPLVDQVLLGHNACCFCYGATGAGKTYTMLGTPEEPGVMIHALRDLFAKAGDGPRSVDVRLSYLEIYNETVRDLLNPGKALDIREGEHGTVVPGLTHYECRSADEVIQLLHMGNQRRTTEETRSNATSSRSHAVLQVHVAMGGGAEGNLSLVDLAGSERHVATEARSQRTVEGANINRSLLALSSCISALVEGKRHIPYRNSKLTKLLKDSLGSDCRTSMIANVSPSSSALPETANTLHWADRAKQITAREGPATVTPTPRVAPRRPASASALALAGAACGQCGDLRDEVETLRAELTRARGEWEGEATQELTASDVESLCRARREAEDRADALGRELAAARAEAAATVKALEERDVEIHRLRDLVRRLESRPAQWRVDLSLAQMPEGVTLPHVRWASHAANTPPIPPRPWHPTPSAHPSTPPPTLPPMKRHPRRRHRRRRRPGTPVMRVSHPWRTGHARLPWAGCGA